MITKIIPKRACPLGYILGDSNRAADAFSRRRVPRDKQVATQKAISLGVYPCSFTALPLAHDQHLADDTRRELMKACLRVLLPTPAVSYVFRVVVHEARDASKFTIR